ncbi:hypothetical protein GHT06_013764 [Daphnia sinensis]|uniref:Uncharacterized protein n=1 Tax=Daphnia sinensis TaxID=1820382 RepID=A0AAD5LL24_9CRUS|nr:hypothetical protein GHT06_013764 [Daphnia sinensis]
MSDCGSGIRSYNKCKKIKQSAEEQPKNERLPTSTQESSNKRKFLKRPGETLYSCNVQPVVRSLGLRSRTTVPLFFSIKTTTIFLPLALFLLLPNAL